MLVTFDYQDAAVAFDVRSLALRERLGEATRVELELLATESVEPRTLVGTACIVQLSSELGARSVRGVVMEATALASQHGGDGRRAGRRYRVRFESSVSVLGLRRGRRVFQHLSTPDIVAQLLDEGGAGTPKRELSGDYAPRLYVTQYDETDLGFLRRLCEEDGLFFRFEPGDEADDLVLMDEPALAPKPLASALLLGDEAGLESAELRAWALEVSRRRAPGKVETADHDFRKPALAIEGKHEDGHPSERAAIYVRAARAADAGAAKQRATRVLESARAEALTLTLSTNAFTLGAGHRFDLERDERLLGTSTTERELLVVAAEHSWRAGEAYDVRVTATPARLPYRLPLVTPRPKAHGIDYAVVTGAAGDEICTDADGCVRIRFPWDREGPTDDASSLPVRVAHPNLAGSLLVPRVGWEVWVGFEEGDPDRPFVLGRAYNGKHMPPVALPANKTMTSLSTSSSPGGGGQSFVHYDDGAGGQSMNWNAALAMARSIAANETVQTVADEGLSIDGSQTVAIGANDSESVAAVRGEEVGSQFMSVSANHELQTPEALHVKTGAETVSCSVLLEQVGSPGGALDALVSQAASAVGGAVPGLGTALGLASTAQDAYEAYQRDGLSGALGVFGKAAAGAVPLVGETIDVLESGGHAPWQGGDGDEAAPAEPAAGGGKVSGQVGGVAAAAGGGAHDAGGGHRVHEISGAATELVGGVYNLSTPGASKWTTLGDSTIAVGGSHGTAAAKVSWLVGGVSTQTTGAYAVSAATIKRQVRVLETTAGGAFLSNASGGYKIKAKGSLNLQCGALKIGGKLVLQCGGTEVVVDGSGLTVKNADVTFNGAVTSATTHRA